MDVEIAYQLQRIRKLYRTDKGEEDEEISETGREGTRMNLLCARRQFVYPHVRLIQPWPFLKQLIWREEMVYSQIR